MEHPKIRCSVWNEHLHEQRDAAVAARYPNGIHGAIADALREDPELSVAVTTWDSPEEGLTEELLNRTDVLFWWGHLAQEQLSGETALRVVRRVREGMGLVALHSARSAKPMRMLLGTGCRSPWRESDDRERIWTAEPSHPIAKGLPACFDLEAEETYGEPFDIPTPDHVVFLGWFSGGEALRCGCCFTRGKGRIFYFQPGHEGYPTFYDPNIRRILRNAAHWCAGKGPE